MSHSNLFQLKSSLLLGSLSLIPNDTLRYTALGLAASVGVIYTVHLQRPSFQLSQLERTVQEAEEIIREAKAYCPRKVFNLTEEELRLLEIKRSASMIQCCILEAKTITWKKYRVFCCDIAYCAMRVGRIRTAVQLLVEAERQRKLTEDINAIETILTSVQFRTLISVDSSTFQFIRQKAYTGIKPMVLTMITNSPRHV
ncbi:hypothetical protein MVEN_00350100 [Mycena venus]|uniref:Uncharacterized protein n=1 Tax=Mycena venus TaxID=2733690 RepID=A0A8H6YU13_9AGAR|nr:hypothetical protein MVEN_00350100 [Mycena venus]